MTEQTIRVEEIRSSVRQRYGQIARQFDGTAVSCCGPSDCCGDTQSNAAMTDLLYDTPDVADLPFDVTGISLGCGDPVTLAELQPGQTVLDLGSGGGIDCFLTARQVGPAGHVIGVDMTADMIDKARANARKMQVENVEFRLGEIEHLPVADETVDVVISNCVINLSPDKPQVFREAYRVLRPGGRLAVSDIVTRVELPAEVRHNFDSWAGCVAGAWVDKDYVAAIEEAGFEEVQIEARELKEGIIAEGAEQLGLDVVQVRVSAEELGQEFIASRTAQGDQAIGSGKAWSIAYSARVTAVKPRQAKTHKMQRAD